mgnify:CR=1 FL=1
MISKYKIPLSQLIESFSLEKIYLFEDADEIEIKTRCKFQLDLHLVLF